MTQLQIAYQQLLETQRSNRAQEALKGAQVDVARYEAALKGRETEARLPLIAAQVDQTLAGIGLTKAQKNKVIQEIDNLFSQQQLTEANVDKTLRELLNVDAARKKMEAETTKLEMDTTKSKADIQKAKSEIVKNYESVLDKIKNNLVHALYGNMSNANPMQLINLIAGAAG